MMPQSPAAAAEPIRLEASSKWHVEYADDSCRLARQFGSGERTSIVSFDQFEPGDSFRLTVASEWFRNDGSVRQATLRFGPAEAEQEAVFLSGKIGDTPALFSSGDLRIAPLTEQEQQLREALKQSGRHYLFEAAPIGSHRELRAAFLSIDVPGKREIVFETGPLHQPLAALRKCIDELLTHWGIDVQRHKSLSQKALPVQSPQNWLRPSDYPTSLLNRGAQGMVHFRLSVDSEGNVSNCHIQRSTRPKGFDEAVCEALMKRAKFRPALDAQGNPIDSYYINTVQFRAM